MSCSGCCIQWLLQAAPSGCLLAMTFGMGVLCASLLMAWHVMCIGTRCPVIALHCKLQVPLWQAASMLHHFTQHHIPAAAQPPTSSTFCSLPVPSTPAALPATRVLLTSLLTPSAPPAEAPTLSRTAQLPSGL